MISAPRKITFTTSQIQNNPPVSPLNSPPITASTSSVSVSVTAVPPTAILTLRWRDMPKRGDDGVGHERMGGIHAG